MEHNGLAGGLYNNNTSIGSGNLGLELPFNQQTQNPQNTLHLHHPQMVAYAHHEPPHQQPIKQLPYPPSSYTPSLKPKQQQLSPLSDEDEPGFVGDDSTSDGKRKNNSGGGGDGGCCSSASPWHRMKWTDNMVRLLIMAVYYIGDDVGGSESNNDSGPGKKKGGGGGLAQKKGKWKSVSSAMMERGFYVSPQQCEDKFNDLNKRYKRVTDILGKGTACKVVENQSLLENMDLTPKMKEEVKKLLNSKHLFFREMCAYHNSCGHRSSTVAAAEQCQPQQAIAQQKCSNSPEDAQVRTNSRSEVLEGPKAGVKRGRSEEAEDLEEEDDSDEDGDDYNDDEDEDDPAQGEEENDHERPQKMPRKEEISPGSMQQFNGELMGVIQDGVKSPWEKRQWVRVRMIQLEEQQLSYQYQAFELEKQRLKWVRFSSKKEREMERAKLENERRRLENERMVLILRQKEVELVELQRTQLVQQQQNSSNKRSDPSSISG